MAVNNLRVLYILPIKAGNHDMPYAKRQIADIERKFNVEVKIFYLESRTSVPYLIGAYRRVRRIIRQFAPDICHAHYGSVNGLFTVMACPKPVMITYHGSDLNKTPTDGVIADFLARLFSNLASLFAARVVLVSEKLKTGLWWRSRNVHIIPIGTNTAEFLPIDKNIAKEKLADEFTFTFPTIVFNANQPKIKRLDIAEKAISHLQKDYPKAQLMKLSGAIDPKKIPLILNAADMLLLCSDNEGSPTIIKEAMACNLPIVATDVGDVSERIKNVNEAIIVEQNSKAIYEGCKQVLNSTSTNTKNGRQEIFNQQLDEASLQKLILKIYNQLKKN